MQTFKEEMINEKIIVTLAKEVLSFMEANNFTEEEKDLQKYFELYTSKKIDISTLKLILEGFLYRFVKHSYFVEDLYHNYYYFCVDNIELANLLGCSSKNVVQAVKRGFYGTRYIIYKNDYI